MRATCIAHPILPQLITPITFDDAVKNYDDPVAAKHDMQQIMLKASFFFFFFFFFLPTIAE
jgi:hypothetical protein